MVASKDCQVYSTITYDGIPGEHHLLKRVISCDCSCMIHADQLALLHLINSQIPAGGLLAILPWQMPIHCPSSRFWATYAWESATKNIIEIISRPD